MSLRISCQLLVFPLIVIFTSAAAADDEKKVKPRFTVGKATTYFDGPLDKDGRIDYAAALNERLGKGVTPQNNSAVLFLQAMGPKPEGGSGMPAEFFKLIGMEPPPEKGEYFVDYLKFIQETFKPPMEKMWWESFDAMLDRAMKRPWKATEQPEVTAWLVAMEKPLSLVIEGTKRTQYFSPVVPTQDEKGSQGLMSARLSGVQKSRAVAAALKARAMLHLGNGDAAADWADLQACHRLARQIARGGTIIELLVGIALDSIACQGDLVFLDSAKLDGKMLANCVRDLNILPPIPGVAEKVNLGERCMFLDTVMMIDRDGAKPLQGLGGGEEILGKLLNAGVDWDPVLKNGNVWYDRLTAALGEKERNVRVKKLGELDAELKVLKKKREEASDIAKVLGMLSSSARNQALSDTLIMLLLPAVEKVSQAKDRSEQMQENVLLAFALARYRLDNGSYPKELAALAPKYVKSALVDLFSGKPLIYKVTEKGYFFYSVGINGKDDGGRGYDDDPRGDDLPVRMPLPELPKK